MKILPLIAALCVGLPAGVFAGPGDAPLSFKGIANISLDDEISGDGVGGWTDEGPENSLDAFPSGHFEFAGIPFDISADAPAIIAPKGKAWPAAPTEFVIPAAGLKGRGLFLLSAHAWEDGPVELARLIVRYESGREDSLPIINHTHTGPWWNPLSLPAAPVAWRGQNRHGMSVGVYVTGYDLADEPLASVTVKASPLGGQLLILGLTISGKPASSLPNQPAWVRDEGAIPAGFPLARPADPAAAPVWQTISSSAPNLPGRSLLMELDPSLSAPSSEQAAEVVRLLKSLGYTGARLAPLDPLLAWPDPAPVRGLLTALDAAGIQSSVTLAGGRPYSSKDDVAAYRELDPRLGEVFFVDPAATKVLDRDLAAFWKSPPVPALAPSSILYDSGFLSYHIEEMTRPHRRMLMNRWAAWLRTRHGDQAGLEKAWQVPGQATPLFPDDNLSRSKVELLSFSNILAASPRLRKRIADQVEFLDMVQREWFLAQKAFADASLPPALWSTTSWIAPSWLRDIQTGLSGSLDAVEERVELLRPSVRQENTKSPFLNVSAFSEPGLADFLTPYYRIAGKPFLVWDSSGMWPGDRDFLRVLRTMAVASLQGWNGILHRKLYSTNFPETLEESGSVPGPALQNPAFLAILPLGRHLFLRGDLDPAPPVVRRQLLLPSEIATKLPAVPSLTNPLGDRYPSWMPFAGGVEAGADLPDWRDEAALEKSHTDGSVTSLTGQLTIRPEDELMEIRTPRTLALAGTLGGQSVKSDAAHIENITGAGTAYMTTLDGLPLSESRAILIGLVGPCNNSGTVVEHSTEPRGIYPTVWKIADPGKAPILMGPVSATFSLPSAAPGQWTITPLDALGRPLAPGPTPVELQPGGGLTLALDNSTHRAPLFLLRHEK